MRDAVAARRYWRSARARTGTGAAFAAYLTLMLGLVTVAPVGRMLWLVATDAALASTVAGLASGIAVPLTVVAAWAAALAVGALRGPAVASPFLAHALAFAPFPQHRAFGRQVWMPVVVLSGLGVLPAVALCAAWGATSGLTAGVAIAALLVGAACGAVAAVLWLAGQVLGSRVAAIGTGVLLAVAAVLAAAGEPVLSAALAHPAVLAALILMAVAGVAGIPILVSRLDPHVVVRQSLAWERATAQAGMLELSGSASVYQPLPRTGRRRRAVGGAGLGPVVLRRSAVGATRTPTRLTAGVLALIAGGCLVLLAVAAAPYAPILGAVGGVVAYAAAGSVSDGIRHVVESVDTSLYGASDVRMLVLHAIFPLIAAVAAMAIGVVVAAILAQTASVWPGLAAAACVAASAVLLRIMNALRPPLPIGLLAPMPTPAGDVSALVRVAWALDAVLLAAAAGWAVAAGAPSVAGVVLAGIVAVTAVRWRLR